MHKMHLLLWSQYIPLESAMAKTILASFRKTINSLIKHIKTTASISIIQREDKKNFWGTTIFL